jgi:magnesium-transporting ATPase (P-type)
MKSLFPFQLKDGNVNCAIVTGDNVLTGIHIAKKAGIIEPDKHVILGASVNDDEIQWVNASDDSEAGDPTVSFPDDTVLAMTGEVWNHLLSYDPKTAVELGERTLVFGRLTPNDKVSIVSTFVENGDITLMW